MIFSLLLGLTTNALADDARYNDLLYETKALLDQKKCNDAEGPSRDLVSDYPEKSESFLMRGLVMDCQKDDPEDIYAIFNQYIALGGDEAQISSQLSRLKSKLFNLDITIDFKSEDPALTVSELELNLIPVVIPGRNQVDSIELKPDGNRYRAEGLVPGRYNLEIESDSRLIASTEQRIEGKAGHSFKKTITLSTAFDEFEEAIERKNCAGADKIFNKNSSYLEDETATRWELDEKLCRSLRDKNVELWLEAWDFANENPSRMTEKQKEIFKKNMGSPVFSVTDQYGDRISAAKLTVTIGEKKFPAEIVNGIAEMMGLPFQEMKITVDAGNKYEAFQTNLDLKKSNQNLSLQLKKKPFTILKLPDYDYKLEMSLIGDNREQIKLNPASEVELLLGTYTLIVQHRGANRQKQIEIGAGQTEVPLPWGYSIVDEKGNVLFADIQFEQKMMPVHELTALELPESPDIRYQGDVSPSEGGTTQVFDIDIGGHPAIEAYNKMRKAEQSLKQAKGKAVLAGGSAAFTTLLSSFFQLQSIAAASLAREVDDPEDLDKYEDYVALTRSKQNLAYGGYTTMGLTYTWLGLTMTKAGINQKRLREAKQEYEEQLKTPILLEQ